MVPGNLELGVCQYPKFRVRVGRTRVGSPMISGSPTISDRVEKSSRAIESELGIIQITFRINSSNNILFEIFTEIT